MTTTAPCAGCGARAGNGDLREQCRYCGAPLDVYTDTVTAAAYLPHRLDRDAAAAAVAVRLGRTRRDDLLTGMYVPHWIVDVSTLSRYSGERGDHYHVTETLTRNIAGETRTEIVRIRRTRWTPAWGSVVRAFAGLVIPAAGAEDTAALTGLAPWPLAETRPCPRKGLGEHRAVRTGLGPDDALDRAKAVAAEKTARVCAEHIGGDAQRVHAVETTYPDVASRLVLLPVWSATCRRGRRCVRVLVNGVTGTVVADGLNASRRGRPGGDGDRGTRARFGLATVLAIVVVLVVVLIG